MTATAAKPPGFAGLNLADELAEFAGSDTPVPKPDPAKLRELSTAAGFPSREPQPAPSKAAARPAAPKAAPAPRPLNFDERLTIRVAAEDKRRFEDLVHDLRTSNGDGFRQALDALEATMKGRGGRRQ
ncbi:MAG: hypothetical protein AB1942_25015 [Pseudomonadota bacterium]